MFKDLINKLKNKKQKLQDVKNTPKKEKLVEPKVDIEISKDNSILKMNISNDFPAIYYENKTKIIDKYGIVNLISNNIIIKGGRIVLIKKGTYYVLTLNNKIYNILIDGDNISIDERIKLNDITEERIISCNTTSNDYKYFSAKHDKGDTFYTMYYDKDDFDYGNLTFSKEEAYEEIKNVIQNLENIEEIKKVLNIDILKRYILDDIQTENKKV